VGELSSSNSGSALGDLLAIRDATIDFLVGIMQWQYLRVK